MSVRSYGSFDEMMADMNRAHDEADARLTDVQRTMLTTHDRDQHWVRPYPEAGCLIFGIAWGWRHSWDESAKYAPGRFETGADAEELLAEVIEEMERYYVDRENSMLFGECFSQLEPRGELGSTHASTVYPISQEAFEEARGAGWVATDLHPRTLAMVGEKAARMAGWTPTLVAELKALSS